MVWVRGAARASAMALLFLLFCMRPAAASLPQPFSGMGSVEEFRELVADADAEEALVAWLVAHDRAWGPPAPELRREVGDGQSVVPAPVIFSNTTGTIHIEGGPGSVLEWHIEPFRSAHTVCGTCIRLHFSSVDIDWEDQVEVSAVPFDKLESFDDVLFLEWGTSVDQWVSIHPAAYVRLVASADGEFTSLTVHWSSGLCMTEPEGGQCEGSVARTERAGSFESNPPGSTYADDARCEWLIEPEDLAPEECVVLSFSRFAVEEGWDFVWVYGADGNIIPTGTALTYEIVGDIIATNSKRITVVFESDESLAEAGFTAQWAVEQCETSKCIRATTCDACMLADGDNCRWCGDAEDYAVGSCVEASKTCGAGADVSITGKVTSCPRYPVEDALLVSVVSKTLQTNENPYDEVIEPDELVRGWWCGENSPFWGVVTTICEDEGEYWFAIEEVDIKESFVNETIPVVLTKLPRLHRLMIHMPYLAWLPDTWEADSSLLELVIEGGKLRALPPSLLRMSSLEELHIMNMDDELATPSFGEMTELYKLILSNVRFSSPFSWDIYEGPRYRFFTHALSAMPPGVLDGERIARSAPHLTEFIIDEMSVSGDISPLLNIPSIRHLSARSTQVNGSLNALDVHGDEVCDNLHTLYLSNTFVSGTLDNLATKCDMLGILDLSHTRISGTIPPQLWSTEQRMTEVRLRNNNLHGEFEFPFIPDSILRDVDLSYNRLRGNVSATFAAAVGNVVNSAVRNVPGGSVLLGHNEFTWISHELFRRRLSVLDIEAAFAPGVEYTLPHYWSAMPSIARLNLAHASLVGTVPPIVEKVTSLRELAMNGNALHGTIPRGASMPNIVDLNLSNNRFSAFHPVQDQFVFGSILENLDLSNNAFTSDRIPDALLRVRMLSVLRTLRLARNDFGGDVGALFTSLGVQSVDVQDNPRLTGTVSEAWFSSSLQSLVLSGTNIEGDVATFANVVFSQLENLQLSNTRVGGTLAHMAFLENMLLTNCAIEGTFPRVLPPDLVRLELSNNKLEGTIPETLDVPQSVISMRLGGNAGMRNTSVVKDPLQPASISAEHHEGLPSFLRYLPQLVTQAGARYSCYSVGGVDTLALETVEIDALYTDHVACPCNVNYWGRAPCCEECPEHAVCEQDTVVPIAAEGWFGEVLALDSGVHGARRDDGDDDDQCASVDHISVVFRECRLVEPGKTACLDPKHRAEDADPTDPNQCADGYTDRLCAQCDDDHFEWGLKCKRCNAAVKTLFPFVLVLAIVAVYALLFKAVSSRKGTLKILVFHLQMIALLSATGNPIPALLLTTSEATSFANMSIPGVECYAPGVEIKEKFTAAFVMPFVLLGVSVLVYVCGVLLRRVSTSWGSAAQSQGRVWLHLNVRVYMFLLVAYYISLSRWLLSVLPCEHGYMNAAPYVPCGGSDHNTMVGMAVVGIIVYVIGFPAGVSWMLWRHRRELQDVSRQRMWGFLYSSYVDDKWWWELVMIVRKLVIVCVIALSPYKSAALPVLVFLVLALSAMLQYRFQPFVSPTDNRLEIASLVIILLTYHLALTFFIPGVSSGTLASVIVFLMNLGWVGSAVFVLTRRKLKGTASRSQMRLASPLLTQTDVAQELRARE